MGGGLPCSAKVSKTILFLCNLVIALAGIAMFACGCWFVASPKSVHLFNVTDNGSLLGLVRGAGGIIIAVGLLVTVVGLLGCCGAIRHKTGCLDCFTALLIIFVIMEIVATILAGVFHTQITDSLATEMQKTINETYGKKGVVTESWNLVQFEFECCGAVNYTDWQSSWWKSNQTDPNIFVPKTCCKLNSSSNYNEPEPQNYQKCNEETRDGTNPQQLYKEGCETKFANELSHYWGVLLGIVIFVIIIQVTGIVLTCCLISAIKRGYEYV